MVKFKPRIPHVAIFMPLTLKGHQDVFRGILQYSRTHGPWQLYRMEGRPGESKLVDLKRWGVSGIITGACNDKDAACLAEARVPVVVVEPAPEMSASRHPLASFSGLVCDSYAVGRLAAQYFLDRHYRHFAFVGEPNDAYWSQVRGDGFCTALKEAGRPCHAYQSPTRFEKADWAAEQFRMRAWLKVLPKPVALFAAMDGRGRQVLDACLSENIAVPNEIAVLGVDNDELICEATFPTMSSIQMTAIQSGYLLAEHLDQLMRRKRLPKKMFVMSPLQVVSRHSTEMTAISDRQIARALEYIWKEAGHRPIQVPDVVQAMGSSRRFAEIHFKQVVGRTIMDEIRRVKLAEVCALLTDTNLSIGEIARQCGFLRESHLAFLFKKHFGLSMSAYRRTTRNGTSRDLRFQPLAESKPQARWQAPSSPRSRKGHKEDSAPSGSPLPVGLA